MKSRKKIGLVVFVTLLIGVNIYAQQLPNYTQYSYNMQILNPAFAGYRSDLSMSLLAREQWVGVDGAPKTKTFSLNTRVQKGIGIGTTVVNDRIGLSQTTNINLDISYSLFLSEHSKLAIGLKGGTTFFSNNLANGITPDNDIYASTTGEFYNVGFGALFYNRKFYVGLSIPYLLETPEFYIQENFINGSLATNPNYFLTSGAVFKLRNNIQFHPSTMVRYTTNLPPSIDFNLNFLYKGIIETGISYRYQNSLSALFTLIVDKKYRIGYAYDYKMANIVGNFNTHEVMLHIDINLGKKRWMEYGRCPFPTLGI